jgi:rare lipoprotein A
MRDAAFKSQRWRGETGAFGNAYRPLPGLLALCAITAPLLFLTGCSGKFIDPRLGVSASPRVVDRGEPVPKGGGHEKAGQPYKVAGKVYAPNGNPENYSAEGLASWYGSAFHGRVTANGEIFDMGAISAAHPTLPLPSYARVTNINNGKSIVVRVNDRGPFHGERALDVSQRVAEILGFKERGMARVRIDYVGPASLKGSDDAKLMATYRENGYAPNAMVARATPPSDISGLYQNPVQARLAAAHQAGAQYPAQPYPGTTPEQPASLAKTGFARIANPNPLAQNGGGMVEPVLSGYAFNPTAFSGFR